MTEPVVAQQFSFTTRVYTAVDEVTGESVGLDELDTRVGWLLDMVACAGAELMARLWEPGTFDVLVAGRDRNDRKLPAQVMATLRTLTFRDTAIATLSARFDPATGRVTAPADSADHVPSGFVRGVLRQLTARSGDSDDVRATRLRITDVQGPPRVAAMARLSAADQQLAQLTVTGHELVLAVKLPTCPAPAGRAQWRRGRLTAALPSICTAGRSPTGICRPWSSTARACCGGVRQRRWCPPVTWRQAPSRSGSTGRLPRWVPPPSSRGTRTGCPRTFVVGPTTTTGSARRQVSRGIAGSATAWPP